MHKCDYCNKDADISNNISIGENYYMHEECFNQLSCNDCTLNKYCDNEKELKCEDFSIK